MAFFSSIVEADLLKCGWTPERSVDTEPYRQSALANNLPYHYAADSFLREFGGLSIWTEALRDRTGSGGLWLDPAKIIADIGADDLRDEINVKEQHLNKSLTFIGDVGEVLLFMADDGVVYGSYSTTLFVGANGYEALERLISRGGPLQTL